MSNELINNMDELQAEHEAAKKEAEVRAAAEQAKKEEAWRKERDEVEAVARAKRNAAKGDRFQAHRSALPVERFG